MKPREVKKKELRKSKSSNQVIITKEKNITRHREAESREGEGKTVRVKEKKYFFTTSNTKRMRRGKKNLEACVR